MNAKALQILVPHGNPTGLKIVDIPGWIGKCFVVPRQNLKDLKNRPEINQPGLYLLFGVDEETSENLVYIGESESFYSRISNHDANKDFWNTAVVFTGGLNRAFVKYLEYRATTLAYEAKRMKVQNKVQPQENTLLEFEKVTVEQYFENIRFVLNVFKFQVFEAVEESYADSILYHLKANGVKASAKILEDGSMTVFAGSIARRKEVGSFTGWSKTARERFLKEGKMVLKGDDSYVTTEDIIFKSPSAAAATLSGSPINGWISWEDEKGNTLDENLRK
jgi:hypothetical protein